MNRILEIKRKAFFGVKKYGKLGCIGLLCLAICHVSQVASAQDGLAGINQANQQIRSYFEAGSQLMYAVGAVLGLIGAVKVFQKWNNGEPDTAKVAAAWFGSCVFLVLVTMILKSFFGL